MMNRNERRHLVMYLKVYDLMTNSLLGYLGDITYEGLMLLSNEPIPKKNYILKVMLPLKTGRPQEIKINANCLWSKKDLNDEIYANGFQLEKVDDAIIKNIDRLVSEIGFRH